MAYTRRKPHQTNCESSETFESLKITLAKNVELLKLTLLFQFKQAWQECGTFSTHFPLESEKLPITNKAF